jgi:hypothetical protein
MFNVLVSGNGTNWESDQRMGMWAERFGEYSGDEFDGISTADVASLKRLEHVAALLMYENGAEGPNVDDVRIGQLKNIRPSGRELTFRFTEVGRVARSAVSGLRHQLQLGEWEMNRTHWAVKDGDIPQGLLFSMTETPTSYDIVFSFAGEDRDYVSEVAEFLHGQGIVIFYDEYEQVTLWGKDLHAHFESIYRKQARFCVMFISKHYADNVWARHERRSAFARAMVERAEYILPVRFDSSEIPGLNPAVGYLDIKDMSPVRLGEMILRKLGRHW